MKIIRALTAWHSLLPTLLLLLLSACGGGGGDTGAGSAPPASGVLVPTVVTPSSSPMSGTSGVRVTLQDGTSVFALGSEAQDTSRITITAAPVPAGADTSQMVGRTLLQFANLPSRNSLAVFRGAGEVVRVYECDSANRKCARLPSVTTLNGGDIAFPVVAGKFYAVQKR